MQDLLPIAERIAARLKARGETIAIAESSTGGLISAALLARTVRECCKASWGIGETGATGPTGNRYGDAAGHTCIAIDGPTSQVLTLETGSADRVANMRRFASQALEMLDKALD